MRKLYLLLLAVLFIFISCPNEAADEKIPTGLKIPVDFMGMVHPPYVPTETDKNILDGMNVVWVLNDCSWGNVNPSLDTWTFGDDNSGYYQFCKLATEAGRKVYAMMGYDVGWIHDPALNGGIDVPPNLRRVVKKEQAHLYVRYVQESIRRLHKYVGAWGIWNEPESNPRFWTGTYEEYYHMVWETIKGIREVETELKEKGELAANDRIKIILGAYSPLATPEFITGLLDNPITKQADGIAYHPYGGNSGGAANLYEAFKKTVTPYGFADKIWLNEIGYPTNGAYPAVTPDSRMPSEVMKTLTEMAIRGAVNAIWYHWSDKPPANKDPTNSEDWFGLVEADRTFKTGATSFALFGQKIPGSIYNKEFVKASNVSNGVQYHYFEGSKNDEHYLIIWNDKPSPQNLTIKLPGTNRKVYDTDTSTWPAPPLSNIDIPTVKENLPESDSYTITGTAKFFVWENSNKNQRPEISSK